MSVPITSAGRNVAITFDTAAGTSDTESITGHSGMFFVNYVGFRPSSMPGGATAYRIRILGPANSTAAPHVRYDSGWIPKADNLVANLSTPVQVPALRDPDLHTFYAQLDIDGGTDGEGLLHLSYVAGRGESVAL